MKRSTIARLLDGLAFATLVILAFGFAALVASRSASQAADRQSGYQSPYPVIKPLLCVWWQKNCGPCHKLWNDYNTDAEFRELIRAHYCVVMKDAEAYPISAVISGVAFRGYPFFYCGNNGIAFSGYTTKRDLLRRLRLDGSEAFGDPSSLQPNYVAPTLPANAFPEQHATVPPPKALPPATPTPTVTPNASNVAIASSDAELPNVGRAIVKEAIKAAAPTVIESVAGGAGWLSFLAPVAGLLGLTPIGAGLGAAGLGVWALRAGWNAWRNRRGSVQAGGVQQRTITQQVGVPIRYDQIPSPQVVHTEQIVVPVETPTREVEAYRWALAEYARRYPGSDAAVNMIESYKTQFLKSPAKGA